MITPSQADAIIGSNGGSFFILGDTDSDGAYNTEAFKVNLTSGLVTLIGQIAANGGIAGAAAKNMTVASAYSGSTFESLSPRVIMTASQTGAADPTTRPDGTALVAGDVWIDW